MKKTLLFCLTLCIGMITIAQNFGTTQFATLSRNDTIIGTFYGSSAFVEAYNAAADSDVVALSAGHFYGTQYISKSIVIRGAGYDTAASVETLPTYIDYSGTFFINRAIMMEGVCTGDIALQTSNVRFNKCRLGSISTYYGSGHQTVITNCLVSFWYSDGGIHNSFINSIILNVIGTGSDIYHNCIVGISPELTNYKEIHNSITFSNDTTSPGNAINVYNTVGIRSQDSAQFYTNREGHNNQTFHGYSSIFKTFDGTYTEGETFELQNNVASTLLGSDSTQIGIYGGALPFNSRVTDPRIIGHSVDTHSDSNNQIKVYIDLRDGNN